MATETSTTRADVTERHVDSPKFGRITNIIRNMMDWKPVTDTQVVVPSRTISNPSPVKKSASNRHPGETHTRPRLEGAMAHELAGGRMRILDLADHVLGHIVSTTLARDILQHLVATGVVQVVEGTGHDDPSVIPTHETQDAIQQAFEDAECYSCMKPDSQEAKPLGTDAKRSGKKKGRTYSFRWTTFPEEPLREEKLVDFLNSIADAAYTFAKSMLPVAGAKRRHRFAAPKNKHQAVPLSYEPDGEDMRPDFVLLPIEAFVEDADGKFGDFDEKYINFTSLRLVGESKNKNLAAGIDQMERYMRGLKRAQPWVHYVLGMAVTRDKVAFLRGDGSGTEQVELTLTQSRGCIELIRIVLGLALAHRDDLGHNPEVELQRKEQACITKNVFYAGNSRAILRRAQNSQGSTISHSRSHLSCSKAASSASMGGSRATCLSQQLRTASSGTSSKRTYSEMASDGGEGGQSKKRKTDKKVVQQVTRFVFYPGKVYGYECLGILFTASSIRGRGTTVFCVVKVEKSGERKLMALKISWQDLERNLEQAQVMTKLQSITPHPNVIVPTIMLPGKMNDKPLTTLGMIRGFSDEQITNLMIENRVLAICVSDLKRPVKYFWGVHDFVRGIRGALLGHEYLTRNGILHRDISENNVVLGLRPGDERGYLIDFDMAILQEAEEPPPDATGTFSDDEDSVSDASKASAARIGGTGKRTKGLRTGTFPYISYNVLWGGRHTHFDDVESFLYVLFLFFFSYAGPLSEQELLQADANNYAQAIGSGRSSHMRNWPSEYVGWSDGIAKRIGDQKFSALASHENINRMSRSIEFKNCLETSWPQELHQPICALIKNSFRIFCESTLRTHYRGKRTEVSHAEFINTLDKWLKKHADLEDKYSNCPFKHGAAGSSS